MTKKTDRKENTVRNEAQRIFDGFTIDALNQVVFTQKTWSEITREYPGRIGRELLNKSKNLPTPVNVSTKDAILYVARYYLNGNGQSVEPSEYSRRYIRVIRDIVGVDLSYLELEALEEQEKDNIREYKVEAILRFMTILLNAVIDYTDIDWSFLEKRIPAAVEGTIDGIKTIKGIWVSNIVIPENNGLTEFYFRLKILQETKTDRKLWKAMLEEYKASHSAGSRFEGFEKIRRELLPKGYAQQKQFRAKGQAEDGPIMPLTELCAKGNTHLAVIGEGGIGKTTFLQHYLKETYYDEGGREIIYQDGMQIPVFIELSRCTDSILGWKRRDHTTFIARYLGKLIENHDSLEDVSEETIEEVERLLQRRNRNGNRTVLLLLDGFNEITTDRDNLIRQTLSDEIRYLQGCSNVRIITTSRDTQAAGYLIHFERIRLIGLEDEDIREYLLEAGFDPFRIHTIFGNPTLMECLRIPLFLWMFTSGKRDDGFLPENAGEIMYLFFHKESPIFHTFYSERQRQRDTGNLDFRTLVILDYILPFIAHRMYLTAMHISASILGKYINDAAFFIRALFLEHDVIPNEDFEYSSDLLREAFERLYIGDALDIEGIINCIHGSLGIMYRYTDRRSGLSSADQYAFIHHHIRDYFASIWHVKILEMIGEVIRTPKEFLRSTDNGCMHPNFQESLCDAYWTRDMRTLIGQVLMEHRNRSVFDEELCTWVLPEEIYPEQAVLNNVIRFCSQLREADINTDVLLDNVIGTIVLERGELAGMDLSGLDLRRICLFNICCSKSGTHENSFLAADFSNSWISEETFSSDKHKYEVSDIQYRMNRCFTYDGHEIRCHNLETGKTILILPAVRKKLEAWDELTLKSKYRFRLFTSNNGEWLCYAHNNPDPKQQGCIELIHVDDGETRKLFPSVRSNVVSTLAFAQDGKYIIAIYDNRVYCVFETKSGKCCLEKLISKSIWNWEAYSLFTESAEKAVYGYAVNDKKASVYLFSENLEDREVLFTFKVSSEREALITFSAGQQVFIYYDDGKNNLNVYEIRTGQIRTIFRPAIPELPRSLQILREHSSECLVFYHDICYQVTFDRHAKNAVVEEFRSQEARMLSGNRDLPMELHFGDFSGYCSHYAILGDEINTYEWDFFTNSVQLKYVKEVSSIENMLPDRIHRDIILLHADLGLSVFHELRFDRNIILRMDGYLMNAHDYCQKTGKLAILYTRPGQAVVNLITIASGKIETIFSRHVPEELLFEEMDVCFDRNGTSLLIQLPKAVYEYRTDKRKLKRFFSDLYRTDELYLHAGYEQDILNIITGYQIAREPYFRVWCSQFCRTGEDDKGYIYTYYRTYELPHDKEWPERFLQDRQQAEIHVDGLLKDDMEDFYFGKGYEGEYLSLPEWINRHDVIICQGILLPYGTKDITLCLSGYDDINKTRRCWDQDLKEFMTALGLEDFIEEIETEKTQQEKVDQVIGEDEQGSNLSDKDWPVRYYKDRLYVLQWNPELDKPKWHDVGYSFYDRETGEGVLMSDHEALEMKYVKKIFPLDSLLDIETAFDTPLINPNKPQFSWQRYGDDWQADDVQPWTDDYNIYYFEFGEFGRVSRFPKNWDYSTKQINYSPGVCVKGCYFVGCKFDGEIRAVLRRSGAVL